MFYGGRRRYTCRTIRRSVVRIVTHANGLLGLRPRSGQVS
ncbi:hypothetical protein FM106_10830 [Brachybacterium faecium]|nr:hypothetical protein FM106_10830 [Brachybacterium faecium]